MLTKARNACQWQNVHSLASLHTTCLSSAHWSHPPKSHSKCAPLHPCLWRHTHIMMQQYPRPYDLHNGWAQLYSVTDTTATLFHLRCVHTFIRLPAMRCKLKCVLLHACLKFIRKKMDGTIKWMRDFHVLRIDNKWPLLPRSNNIESPGQRQSNTAKHFWVIHLHFHFSYSQ